MTRPPSDEQPPWGMPPEQPQHPTDPSGAVPAAPGHWPGTPYQPPQHGTPYQQPPHGDTEYGASLYAASQYGAPQYGPPQYGPPQYGPPQYGAPHHGQQPYPYGPPQYGQQPYPYGAPYGQHPGGRPPNRRKLVLGLVLGGLALVALVVAAFVAASAATPDSTVPAPAATLEPTGLGDDPAFDQLARSCHDGDMSSCDDLYDRSELDSAYEEYGDTCAGRRGGGAWAYCEDVFSDTD